MGIQGCIARASRFDAPKPRIFREKTAGAGKNEGQSRTETSNVFRV
jgi:hypothetical protein